jgi:dUTP pyrophosphatase
MTNIKFLKLSENAIIPNKGSDSAAGYDLCSTEDHVLMPMERKLFKIGFSIAIPIGMYGRIAPRSGLAFKHGIDVLAGVIDADYRGEIGVILINFGTQEKQIKVGDAIAQMIFESYNTVIFHVVTTLDSTERGEGGYGSTDFVKKHASMVELYERAGGVQVKAKYSDEITKNILSAQ